MTIEEQVPCPSCQGTAVQMRYLLPARMAGATRTRIETRCDGCGYRDEQTRAGDHTR